MTIHLGQLAYSRSGDKGASSNVGVIARHPSGYPVLLRHLTPEMVREFFQSLGVTRVTRYELPNLGALNFILHDILDGGGSLSLRTDAQGKALGQMILNMSIELDEKESATLHD